MSFGISPAFSPLCSTFCPQGLSVHTFAFEIENLQGNGKEVDTMVYFHFTTDITPSKADSSEMILRVSCVT